MISFYHPLLISVLLRRDGIELEEKLRLLEATELMDAKQASSLASGEDEHPASALAELRSRHQASATTASYMYTSEERRLMYCLCTMCGREVDSPVTKGR